MSLAAVLLLAWGASPASAEPFVGGLGPVAEAMKAEISRSTASLKMEGYQTPYYIGLRSVDEYSNQFSYSLGQPLEHYSLTSRTLTPDARVGGYELDDHPLEPSSDSHDVTLPDADDVYALRYRIWSALDDEYKQSAASFLRKQAQRVERGKADYETDDLSREKPSVSSGPVEFPAWDWDSIEQNMKDASAAFRGNPILLYSWVNLKAQRRRKIVITSEGTDVRFAERMANLSMAAGSYADDGMRLAVSRSWTVPSPESLPDHAALQREALLMQAELMELRQASSTSPFNAPAILDPSASAALFSALATRLEGPEQRNPEGSQTFRGKVGQRIMPSFVSLIDDPRQPRFNGTPLAGHYPFDEEGMPAQRAALIEKGVLKSFLLSRYPVLGFPHTNGHGRADVGKLPMGRFANLFLESDKTVTVAELKAMLMKECRKRGKPYGLWVKHVSRWQQQSGTQEHQAFRAEPELVYLVDAKTGRETLIRGLDVVGTPLSAAAKIVAAGKDAEVTNYLDEQASGTVPVGVVSPSLLITEIETQRSEGKPERPPILPPPKP